MRRPYGSELGSGADAGTRAYWMNVHCRLSLVIVTFIIRHRVMIGRSDNLSWFSEDALILWVRMRTSPTGAWIRMTKSARSLCSSCAAPPPVTLSSVTVFRVSLRRVPGLRPWSSPGPGPWPGPGPRLGRIRLALDPTRRQATATGGTGEYRGHGCLVTGVVPSGARTFHVCFLNN